MFDEISLYNQNKEYDGAIDLYDKAEVLKDIYNYHIELIEVKLVVLIVPKFYCLELRWCITVLQRFNRKDIVSIKSFHEINVQKCLDIGTYCRH